MRWAFGPVAIIAVTEVSGRRDSNPRPSAWEADALPLSYSRVSDVMAIGADVLWRVYSPMTIQCLLGKQALYR